MPETKEKKETFEDRWLRILAERLDRQIAQANSKLPVFEYERCRWIVKDWK